MRSQNFKKFFIWELLVFFVFCNCFNINAQITNKINYENNFLSSEKSMIPVLDFSPKFYDFSFVKEGSVYHTSFEIWNNGTDILEWSLRTRHPYLSVNPKSGESSGEHDIVTVTLNTSDLSLGNYESNVYIHAAGDYIFNNYFIVNNELLEYYPKMIDFGFVEKGETIESSFEIWNNGTKNLDWNLQSNNSWINFEPVNGSSNGEHDNITIKINTANLSNGEKNGKIIITSNGGNANLTFSLIVDQAPSKPIINGPSSGKINTNYTYTLNSIDPDKDKVFYCIKWGDNTDDVIIGPFESGENAILYYTWQTAGKYVIRAKSIDMYGIESDWETFNLDIAKNKANYIYLINSYKSNYLSFLES
jgi:hypothetical protein